MVECIEQIEQEKDPYILKLEEVEDESLQSKLKSLYEMGYVEFGTNKYVLESNPTMDLQDIIAILVASGGNKSQD